MVALETGDWVSPLGGLQELAQWGGSTTFGPDTNEVYVLPWLADVSFAVSAVLVDVGTTGVGTGEFAPVIYEDNDGAPGSLLWSGLVDVTTTRETKTVSDVDVAITAGRIYWFGGFSSSPVWMNILGVPRLSVFWPFAMSFPDMPPAYVNSIRTAGGVTDPPDPFGPWAASQTISPRLYLQAA